jgi:hypothetical protein
MIKFFLRFQLDIDSIDFFAWDEVRFIPNFNYLFINVLVYFNKEIIKVSFLFNDGISDLIDSISWSIFFDNYFGDSLSSSELRIVSFWLIFFQFCILERLNCIRLSFFSIFNFLNLGLELRKGHPCFHCWREVELKFFLLWFEFSIKQPHWIFFLSNDADSLLFQFFWRIWMIIEL